MTRLLPLLLALCCFSILSSVHAIRSFSVDMQVSTSEDSRLEAIVSFKSGVDANAYILPWNTPLDTLSPGLSFMVYKAGVPLEYEGIVARRLPATNKDYINFKHNEQHSAVIDLAAVYDVSAAGEYVVELLPGIVDVYIGDNSKSIASLDVTTFAMSKVVTTIVLKESVVSRRVNASALVGHTYRSCSSAQTTTVNNAWGNYGVYTRRSVAAMPSASTSSVYSTWFGTYQASRFNTVNNIYANLNRDSASGNHLFDCAGSQCSSGVIAYVYANDASTIYLCSTFFSLPATGPTSQADTYIHEVSHFNTMGGTRDYAYGQSNCRSLASSNPANAVLNADNYAFFSVFA